MPSKNFLGVPVVFLSSLGDIDIHLLEQVTITHESLVSKNPTETGVNITDHLVNLPAVIQMSGRFVDAPLSTGGVDLPNPFQSFATALTQLENVTEALSIRQWNALENLRESKTEFDVVVQQGTYENMVFRSLSAPRAKGDGGSIRFQAELQQILVTGTIPLLGGGAADDVAHSSDALDDLGQQGMFQ